MNLVNALVDLIDPRVDSLALSLDRSIKVRALVALLDGVFLRVLVDCLMKFVDLVSELGLDLLTLTLDHARQPLDSACPVIGVLKGLVCLLGDEQECVSLHLVFFSRQHSAEVV